MRSFGTPPVVRDFTHPGRGEGMLWDVLPGQASTGGGTATVPTSTLMLVPLAARDFTAPIKGIAITITGAGSSGSKMKGGAWRIDKSVMRPFGAAIRASAIVNTDTGTGTFLFEFTQPYVWNPDEAIAIGLFTNNITAPAITTNLNGDAVFNGFVGGPSPSAAGSMPQRWSCTGPAFADDLMAVALTGATLVGSNTTPRMSVYT